MESHNEKDHNVTVQTQKSAIKNSLIPAASVIALFNDKEGMKVLLLKRNSKIVFHGGAWVFPGGKIDQEDLKSDNDIDNAKVAACREIYEEAGIQITSNDLIPFSHWTTPETYPRRFATWFFLVVLESKVVRIDDGEIIDSKWFSPEEALSAHLKNEIELPPTALVTLSQMRSYQNAQDFIKYLPVKPEAYLPKTLETDSGKVSLYQGDVAYLSLDLSQKGNYHRLVMKGHEFHYHKTI